MKAKQNFRIAISKNETICCGTYLKDSGLSLGMLTPDGDSYSWGRFLRKLKDGDILEIRLLKCKRKVTKL
jgi:hypothetical protein